MRRLQALPEFQGGGTAGDNGIEHIIDVKPDSATQFTAYIFIGTPPTDGGTGGDPTLRCRPRRPADGLHQVAEDRHGLLAWVPEHQHAQRQFHGPVLGLASQAWNGRAAITTETVTPSRRRPTSRIGAHSSSAIPRAMVRVMVPASTFASWLPSPREGPFIGQVWRYWHWAVLSRGDGPPDVVGRATRQSRAHQLRRGGCANAGPPTSGQPPGRLVCGVHQRGRNVDQDRHDLLAGHLRQHLAAALHHDVPSCWYASTHLRRRPPGRSTQAQPKAHTAPGRRQAPRSSTIAGATQDDAHSRMHAKTCQPWVDRTPMPPTTPTARACNPVRPCGSVRW